MTSSPERSLSPRSRANPLPGRILAIDYGRRRLGLAISDELELTAQPLATLNRTNRAGDLRRLRELARQHGVRRIVVGHPLRLDGSPGEMAAEAARFAARVGKELGLPVELADERLSSWEAGQIQAEAPRASRRRRRNGRPGGRGLPATVDDLAASVFLRDYLDRRHREKA